MLLVLVAGLLLGLLVLHYRTRRKFLALPGPGLQLPFIGHYQVFLNIQDPIGHLHYLYKKYSRKGMMHLHVLGLDQIYIGDFETIKYLFNHPDVQNRGHSDWRQCLFSAKMSIDREIPHGPLPGVIMSQGSAWVEQRRFTLKTLRDFGFGKASMEEMILEEVQQFVAFLLPMANSQEPVDMSSQFNLPILNALWRVTVGDRLEYTDPRLQDIVQRMGEFLAKLGNPGAVLALTQPWLFRIFPTLMDRHEDLRVNKDMKRLMEQQVEEHEASIDVNEPRDFIDKALMEMRTATNPASSFHGEQGRISLVNTLLDLFVAGSETTSTTLTWAMLYMVRHLEVQAKVQTELDREVGPGRLPMLADRERLPYTSAVLLEVQRCGNIVPSGVHHMSARDITINGITIPANTMIAPLMAEILKGDDYWGDGASFRPERFLDATGGVRKDEHLIPFSVGKRQCLGETLAKVELFLFFAGLLIKYRILPEVEGSPPPELHMPGITSLPGPFRVILQPRN